MERTQLTPEDTGHLGGNRWSGRPDLNRRPPAPQAGALTRLRHGPNETLLYSTLPYSLADEDVSAPPFDSVHGTGCPEAASRIGGLLTPPSPGCFEGAAPLAS